MISERISEDIPPQAKILNMVIPILMSFYNLVSNWSAASSIKTHHGIRHPTKGDVINDVKLFPTVYRKIYCCKFLTLSNQMSRYKSNCIRIIYLSYLIKQNVVFSHPNEPQNSKAVLHFWGCFARENLSP